ncbi:hypothetical protein BCR39DRAFT_503568 [Naematelia encephala]|uniref:Uncharacterized protein n=1 Tax=Naematelia encephala TaxID=71784 RepID=A0A1Y2BI71_9TREE|nr:hypothetical protein BCR39DRAFT_503568 [Naematelia encephala]
MPTTDGPSNARDLTGYAVGSEADTGVAPTSTPTAATTGSGYDRTTVLAIYSGIAGALVGLAPPEPNGELDWSLSVGYGVASTIWAGFLNWSINKCLRSFGHRTEAEFRETMIVPLPLACTAAAMHTQITRGTATAIAASTLGIVHASAYWPERKCDQAHTLTQNLHADNPTLNPWDNELHG